MRQFFDFGFDSRPNNYENVCDYYVGHPDDLEYFDTATFRRCERFEGPFPPHVKLWMKRGRPTDALGEPLSWPIWSENLLAIFKPFVKNEIQEIPPPLFYADTEAPVAGYRIVNILRSLDAIDLSKSVTSEMNILGTKILNVIRAVYRADAIPPDVHIFRPIKSLSRIVISEELAQAMTSKVVGIALIRTDSM